MKHDTLRLLAGLVAITGLYSCATGPQNSTTVNGIPADPSQFGSSGVTNGLRSGDNATDRKSIDAILNKREERPGLATGWGNEKASSVTGQSFVRASSKPAGTDVIYYNDKKGIEAMSGSVSKVEGMQTAAGNLVEWGVKGRGGFLATYKEGYGGFLAAQFFICKIF
jgi:hypothetical protein